MCFLYDADGAAADRTVAPCPHGRILGHTVLISLIFREIAEPGERRDTPVSGEFDMTSMLPGSPVGVAPTTIVILTLTTLRAARNCHLPTKNWIFALGRGARTARPGDDRNFNLDQNKT
jgi:hypothetical protein